jgi:hypothetical protein
LVDLGDAVIVFIFGFSIDLKSDTATDDFADFSFTPCCAEGERASTGVTHYVLFVCFAPLLCARGGV